MARGMPEDAVSNASLPQKKAWGEKQKEHSVDSGRAARDLMFLLRSLLASSRSTSMLSQPV